MSDVAGEPAEWAASMLIKLRAFADRLEPGERQALAALMAPGVDAAWSDAPEVEGFAWRPETVADHLAREVRDRGPRIEW